MRGYLKIVTLLVALLITSQIATAEDKKETGPVEVKIDVSSRALNHWKTNMLDGDTATSWTSDWSAVKGAQRAAPVHRLSFHFKDYVKVKKVTVIPENRPGAGFMKDCEADFGNGQKIAKTAQNGKEVVFDSPTPLQGSKSLIIHIKSTQGGVPWVSIAEVKIELEGGNKIVCAEPDEKELKEREERRRRGFVPLNEGDAADMLAVLVRTYEAFKKEGVNLDKFKGGIEKFCNDFEKRQKDGNFAKEIKKFRREMVFSHPGLNFQKLLVNKRRPPGYSHQCDQYLGRHAREAVGMCVLDNWKSDKPSVKVLLEGKLPKGDYRKPVLDFDGKKIAFAFCDLEANPSKKDAWQYFLWECNVDGSGLKQITGGPEDDRATWEDRATVVIEDFDPCYLPNNDIVFISTRSQTFGRCHGSRYSPTYLVYRLYRGNGKYEIKQLSFGEANEWDPSVLENGRIVYSRWDYINRHDVRFQSLWTMNPDGTGIAHYHGNYSPSPCKQSQCKAIPNSKKSVFIADAHHSYSAGSVVVFDPLKGEDGWEPLTRVTPERSFPECGDPYGGGTSCTYASPYPISENLFFVSRLPRKQAWQGRRDDDTDARYEIYLIDSLGGRELVYKDDTTSCFAPIPLRPTKKPALRPSMVDVREKEDVGTFYVQNVYDCRQPFEPGSAKWLRVNKIYGQLTRGKPYLSTANNEILKECLGYVPINKDGSVAFKAPSGFPLQLQVCDDKKMAVMTMRSFVTLQKGEMTSCTGCHEPREAAPTTGYGSPPARITVKEIQRTPGPQYDGGFSFARSVQPILDRHCIKCHGLKKKEKNISLVGTPSGNGNAAYKCLVSDGNRIKVAYRNRETAFSVPREYYAAAGTFAKHLLENEKHKKNIADVTPEEMTRIIEWLDLNGQYYGDYSHNRVENATVNLGSEEGKAFIEFVKSRFGDEIAKQPVETLINVAMPSESRVLKAALPKKAGGWEQFQKGAFKDANDPEYKKLVELVNACIPELDRVDIRGTCGSGEGKRGCSCGCCFVREIDDAWKASKDGKKDDTKDKVSQK